MLSKQQIQLLKRYCREPIENIRGYEEALNSTEKYDCHHINELTFTKDQLIKMNMYYNRPASELVMLTHSEHAKLHQRHNMPSARFGNKHPMDSKVYLLCGDKSPHWKGDAATEHSKYKRILRAKRRALRNLQNVPLTNTH